MPKISVIMPAYNAELYIRQAIDSVLTSTLQDLELLVVNDGSTDNTGEILSDYVAKDRRVRVFNQPNSGRPSIPKNLALQHVRGEYVCFLDNDDYFAPNKLELMVAGLDAHPEWCAVFHDLQLVDTDDMGLGVTYLKDAHFLTKAVSWIKSIGDDWYDCGKDFFVFQSLFYAGFHTQSVMIARHRLAWDHIAFDTKFTICEDTDLWLRIGMMGGVGYLDRVLSYYRQHETNITRKRLVWAEDTVLLHVQNYQRVFPKLTRPQLKIYRRKIAGTWRELGYVYYRTNHPCLATKAYINSAVWAQPLQALLPIAKAWIRLMLLRRPEQI